MRATPQSPRSRFPKGPPRQSGNHAPNPHPRRTPNPPSHPPLPISHARLPNPFALSLSKGPQPPTPPAAPHTPIVVPAKAGIQRGAGRGTPTQTPVASPTPQTS